MANHFVRHVSYLTLEACVAHRTNCAFPPEVCVPLPKRAFCLYTVRTIFSSNVVIPRALHNDFGTKLPVCFRSGTFRRLYVTPSLCNVSQRIDCFPAFSRTQCRAHRGRSAGLRSVLFANIYIFVESNLLISVTKLTRYRSLICCC